MVTSGSIVNGDYQVERMLGRGGMASVFLVRNLRLQRWHALKVLTGEYSTDEAFVARFRQEADILAALEHPHIVRIHDFNVTPEGVPYLVMELLNGQDLATLLSQQQRLPVSMALQIFRQVADALSFAHARGVIHRDLKPGNIYLCTTDVPGPVVKVLDFGIAKVRGAATLVQTDPLTLMGTPPYMSPEQAQGLMGTLDHRSDQFSLASILYELLTGLLAFSGPGDSVLQTMNRVVSAQPPLFPADRPELGRFAAVLRRAWSRSPEQRYASISEFVAAIDKQEPEQAATITMPLRKSTGIAKLLLGSAISGALVVGIGAWWYIAGHPTPTRREPPPHEPASPLSPPRLAMVPKLVQPEPHAPVSQTPPPLLPRMTAPPRRPPMPVASRAPAKAEVLEGNPAQQSAVLGCVHSHLGGALRNLAGKTIVLRGPVILQEVSSFIPVPRLVPFHECLREAQKRQRLPAAVHIRVRGGDS